MYLLSMTEADTERNSCMHWESVARRQMLGLNTHNGKQYSPFGNHHRRYCWTSLSTLHPPPTSSTSRHMHFLDHITSRSIYSCDFFTALCSSYVHIFSNTCLMDCKDMGQDISSCGWNCINITTSPQLVSILPVNCFD